MFHFVLRFKDSVKIVHFIGATKPWHHPYNTATKEVTPLPESGHNKDYLQIWWDIFMSLVQPTLDPSLVSYSARIFFLLSHDIICSHWSFAVIENVDLCPWKLIFLSFIRLNFCLSVHDCELSFPWNYEIYRYMPLNACAAFLCNLCFWQAKKR